MATGPDDYMNKTTRELSEKDFYVLAEVWEVGFVAAGKLLVLVEDGEREEDDKLMDMPLHELVGVYHRGEL